MISQRPQHAALHLDDPIFRGVFGPPLFREETCRVTWIEAYACFFLRHENGIMPPQQLIDGAVVDLEFSTAFGQRTGSLT